MKNPIFLTITILILLCSQAVWATNYYVKNGGDDSKTGLDDANALAVDFSGLGDVDIDGTGTITIGVPYPSTAIKEFTTTSTLATAVAAGWYSVPDDNLSFNVTEDVNTDKPGTSGHVITYTGEITGGVVVDEHYITFKDMIIN